MSGKASDVAAWLGRSLTPVPQVSPEPCVDSGGIRTTERLTVDLSPDLNDSLARWATQQKRSVGRRVPKTEVVRVLIELLLEDPSLAAQAGDRLRRSAGRI
jgi:hypothetical protein